MSAGSRGAEEAAAHRCGTLAAMSDKHAGREEVDLDLACDESEQDRQDWRDLQFAVHGPPDQRAADISARLTWSGIEPDATWVVRVRVDGRLVSYVWIMQRDHFDRWIIHACAPGIRLA